MIAIYSALSCVAMWVLFLAYVPLRANWSRLPTTTKALGSVVVIVAFVCDVIFNAVIGTIIFLDIPREATFTKRVSKLKRGLCWRARLAKWICENLLDPFEVGGHCR